MSNQIYKGQLKRAAAPDTIEGYISDTWGWTIRLIGTRDPGGGYTLTGTLDTPPPGLRIPLIDDAVGGASTS